MLLFQLRIVNISKEGSLLIGYHFYLDMLHQINSLFFTVKLIGFWI